MTTRRPYAPDHRETCSICRAYTAAVEDQKRWIKAHPTGTLPVSSAMLEPHAIRVAEYFAALDKK